jgi:hypothetical protein
LFKNEKILLFTVANLQTFLIIDPRINEFYEFYKS